MSDLETLKARIAALEAQINPAAPPPLPPIGHEPEVRVTQHISTLVGGVEQNYLSRNIREVRQFVQAVALCYGVDAPRQHVPKLWLEPLRRLAAARASGLAWRAALTEAGLGVPDDLVGRIQDLRGELDSLWDTLLPVVAMALGTTQTVGQARIKERLGKLLD